MFQWILIWHASWSTEMWWQCRWRIAKCQYLPALYQAPSLLIEGTVKEHNHFEIFVFIYLPWKRVGGQLDHSGRSTITWSCTETTFHHTNRRHSLGPWAGLHSIADNHLKQQAHYLQRPARVPGSTWQPYASSEIGAWYRAWEHKFW